MRTVRWLPLALIAVALVVVIVLDPDFIGEPGPGDGRSAPPADESQTAIATPGASSGPGVAPPSPAWQSYVGPTYDTNLIPEPTAQVNQHKVWFNDGSWWAVMAVEGTGQFQIHELDWETQRWVDTGVLVDERPFVTLDAVWDGSALHVAGGGRRNSEHHALRITRFSYDPDARRYVLDADYPVRITELGTESASLARTAAGELWLAFIVDLRVHVSHGDPSGAWSQPIILPVEEATADADRTLVVGRGDDTVVIWTNVDEDELHAAVHAGGAVDEGWSVTSTPVDGLQYGVDRLSAAATDGEVILAVETSLDRVPNRNEEAAQVVVVRLGSDGTSSQSLFGTVREGHQNPLVLLDARRGTVSVVAEAEQRLYLKWSSLTNISFPGGVGAQVAGAAEEDDPEASPTPSEAVESPTPSGSPAVELPDRGLTYPSSTGQDLGALSEVVVLVSDAFSSRYEHIVISPADGRLPPADAEAHTVPAPPELAGGLPPGASAYLVRETFSRFSPGSAVGTGWTTRETEEAPELITIIEPTPADPSLQVATTPEGSGARACRGFAATSTGVVTVSVSVQLLGDPDSDASITVLRAPDGSGAAAVRFGSTGTFRYFVGDVRVRSQVPYQAGVWYTSVISVDLDAQTYDWRIGPLGSATALLDIRDVRLRLPTDALSELCVQAADGGGSRLLLDDVEVRRGPG